MAGHHQHRPRPARQRRLDHAAAPSAVPPTSASSLFAAPMRVERPAASTMAGDVGSPAHFSLPRWRRRRTGLPGRPRWLAPDRPRRRRAGGRCARPPPSRSAPSPLSSSTSARCVGCARRRLRVRMRKSEVFSFRTTVPPASRLRSSWRATCWHRPRAVSISSARRAGVAPEGRLGRDALDGPVRRHRAIVLAVHEAGEPAAELAVARFQLPRALRLQVGNGADTLRLHAPRCGRADAVDLAHRQRRQEGLGLRPADHREAGGLAATRTPAWPGTCWPTARSTR